MSSTSLLTGTDAATAIRDLTEAGGRILGVDGFTLVEGGRRADLDLILDVSSPPIAIDDAAKEAIAFVEANDRPDVVWEVVYK